MKYPNINEIDDYNYNNQNINEMRNKIIKIINFQLMI